ncbi:zinc ribbon domain-containing protein [Candidatus Thorarchaeota archaeon]|nr:MAG: zinc ribbon domain-containing protein [Candidatus Thorarchaeota archaeon]
MGFDETSGTICPHCGHRVPSGNLYCGRCGSKIGALPSSHGIEITGSSSRQPRQQIPRYNRKFSLFERITKLLTSPEEAMEDISLAPDYGGVIALFIVWTVISVVGFITALQKIQFTGPYANQVYSLLSATATITIIIIPIFLIIRWLIKSYLIRHACDSNFWNFETAASVTGYAYLPNVIFGLIGVIVTWILVPSVVISTADLEQALIQMETFSAQTLWITVGISTLFSFIALFWKSSLGSHGAYFGTHKNCEKGTAFGYFMVIGLLGLIIDLISSFL